MLFTFQQGKVASENEIVVKREEQTEEKFNGHSKVENHSLTSKLRACSIGHSIKTKH